MDIEVCHMGHTYLSQPRSQSVPIWDNPPSPNTPQTRPKYNQSITKATPHYDKMSHPELAIKAYDPIPLHFVRFVPYVISIYIYNICIHLPPLSSYPLFSLCTIVPRLCFIYFKGTKGQKYKKIQNEIKPPTAYHRLYLLSSFVSFVVNGSK